VQFGALGDIHGDFESARRIMRRHPDIPFWLCVGDVATDDGRYEPLPAPLYWIKGNNENFDVIGSPDLRGPAYERGPAYGNLLYIPNGTLVEIPVGRGSQPRLLRVAGLGGTFAPTWYHTPARELPHPKKGSAKARDDKRRHFVREEVEACRALGGVDVFMSHEAPRPFRVGPIDAGKTPINEVLAAMKPRLHLFGHHHRCSDQERQGVRSVGLDLAARSYLLLDANSLAFEVRTPDQEGPA
jgi:hypothetical protein